MTTFWSHFRLLSLGAGFALALWDARIEPSSTAALNRFSQVELVAMLATPLAFFPAAMLLVVGIQTKNPLMARVWTRPTHSSNPFRLRDPLHFFHFGAWFTGASGLGYLLAGSASRVMGVMCTSMCVGLLLGVRVFPLVFKKKFEPAGAAAG